MQRRKWFKPNYGMVHKTKKEILDVFRHHCKFQSRNIKLRSSVIKIHCDGTDVPL